MRPKPLLMRIPRSEATVKIYGSELVFSEAAVKLLGIGDDSPLVVFMVDRDAELAKRKRIYVAAATGSWPVRYPTSPKGCRRVIRCRDLCRKLALDLDGFGTYRVCEDDSYAENGIIWYNIFFRRYD